MNDNDYIQTIEAAVDMSRRKRAAGASVANDAIYLAKDTETALGDIAGTCGKDSEMLTGAATMVAAEMLNIIITVLNSSTAYRRRDLATARKAITYISRLPVSAQFRDERLTPQLHKIKVLMSGHNVPDTDADIDFSPTMGDDACFAACSSSTDFVKYLRRHPSGRHAEQARAAITRINETRRRRQASVKIALQLSGAALAIVLLVAVCMVTGVSTGVTIGLSILLAGAAAAFVFVRTFNADDSSPRRTRLVSGVAALALLGSGAAVVFTADRREQRAELDYILAHSDEDALVAYLCNPRNTFYADDAIEAYLLLMDSVFFDPARMAKPSQVPPLARMANLAKAEDLPERFRTVLDSRVKSRTDSLYRMSLAANDLDAWLNYQALAPSDLYYDSSERIDSIETESWSREPEAWALASRQATRESYSRYLDLYPSGPHASLANTRLIDMEVNDYRNQGQVTVESISRIADYVGKGSMVCIYNNSAHDVKFMFSGPGSVSFTVPAGSYDERVIADGVYQVLAHIDNPQRDRFSFTQSLDHGIYSSTIEIGGHNAQ